MIRNSWQRARLEWRQNPRLRLGMLVAFVILTAHLALTLSDRQKALQEQYRRDSELFARLQVAGREIGWPRRAHQAEAALVALRESIPAARTDGVAQAELQAWLTRQAEAAKLQSPTVRVEETVEVEGHPELRQVLAKLDAGATNFDLHPFLRSLSEGLPWVQVERAEIAEGQPVKVSVIVRAYYRKSDALAAATSDGGATPSPIRRSGGSGGAAASADGESGR